MDRTPPRWFTIAAIAVLLLELSGVAAYLMDALRGPAQIAALPLDQRLMWQATPTWMYVAYAIAVFTGLAGAVALLLRRSWSVPLLGLSLAALIVQFSGIYLVPELRRVVPPSALLVPAIIIILCALAFALARLARRRGWLR